MPSKEVQAIYHGPSDELVLGEYTLRRGEKGTVTRTLVERYRRTPNHGEITIEDDDEVTVVEAEEAVAEEVAEIEAKAAAPKKRSSK